MGTLILSAIALGKFKDIKTAVRESVEIKKVFFPDGRNLKIYSGNYDKYCSACESLKKYFS